MDLCFNDRVLHRYMRERRKSVVSEMNKYPCCSWLGVGEGKDSPVQASGLELQLHSFLSWLPDGGE
jgi:hypothetical protein